MVYYAKSRKIFAAGAHRPNPESLFRNELLGIILYNKATLYNIVFRAASKSLLEFAKQRLLRCRLAGLDHARTPIVSSHEDKESTSKLPSAAKRSESRPLRHFDRFLTNSITHHVMIETADHLRR